jgi:hypothetical protein
MDFNYLFFAVFGVFLLYFLYQILTKGFKGATFGGKIDKTYGEIALQKQFIMNGKIRVHKVAKKDGNQIGIELVHTSPLSYQMVPAHLSKEEAQKLIQLLTVAINEP